MSVMGIEVGLVGVQEVINGYRGPLVPICNYHK